MKKRKGRFFVLFLFIVSAMVLFGYFVNTILFQRSLNGVVGEYVAENNRQLAEHVSYRLKSGSEYISDFADTLSRMPEFLLTEDLLERKADALELDGIVIIYEDGSYLSNQEINDECQNWIVENPNIWKKSLVSYIHNENIVFSSPVIKNSKANMVVVGLQSYQELQSLVNRVDFQEQGVSVLLDIEGRKPIMFEKGIENTMEREVVIEIIKGLFNPSYKMVELVDDYYIASSWVNGTQWMQIAILPTSFMMSQSKSFINFYFILMVVTMLLFGFVIVYLKREEGQREQSYLSDMLTGGLNREGFLRRSRDLIDRKNYMEYSLLCVNVKNFRMVNETWGEDTGNQVLEVIYRILNRLIVKGELACRNSMDHFLLLLHERDKGAIEQRLNHMVEMINHDIQKQCFGYQLEFATGIYRLDDSLDIALAISYATYASKQAKDDEECIYYDGEIAQTIAYEKELNELFEESIQNHYFKVYLQPKVGLQGSDVCQAEALVRWIHPIKGVIYPNQFIPLFEKNNRICELDLYMFEEVCRLVSERIERGLDVFEISVNISRFHLRSAGGDIWKEYQEIKNRYKIPDGLIELELTETLMVDMTQLGFVKNVLAGFRSCGLKVALDDFGFAYSSLALLKEFEVDTLKMDKSFFINENLKSRKIVQSVIQLAHSLDMRVVAEGIEETEQVEVLRRMNCDLIQGYVYSKPLPIEEFETWRSQA